MLVTVELILVVLVNVELVVVVELVDVVLVLVVVDTELVFVVLVTVELVLVVLVNVELVVVVELVDVSPRVGRRRHRARVRRAGHRGARSCGSGQRRTCSCC